MPKFTMHDHAAVFGFCPAETVQCPYAGCHKSINYYISIDNVPLGKESNESGIRRNHAVVFRTSILEHFPSKALLAPARGARLRDPWFLGAAREPKTLVETS